MTGYIDVDSGNIEHGRRKDAIMMTYEDTLKTLWHTDAG